MVFGPIASRRDGGFADGQYLLKVRRTFNCSSWPLVLSERRQESIYWGMRLRLWPPEKAREVARLPWAGSC